MSMPELADLWRSIETAGPLAPAALRFLKTGIDLPTGPVLAGIDGAGQRHLCIPAPVAELGREDRGSRGVTMEVRVLLDAGGKESPFVDIHCRRPDLNSLFEVVAGDMLTEARKQPNSPFSVGHRVLERWRSLLESEKSPLLGPEQLAALLAELLLLERMGGSQTPPLKYWLGPEKGPHDFVCGAIDFEVKSTLRTSGREVEINGLSQLAASPETNLYLWLVRLRPSPGRGTTVPATIGRLVDAGVDAAALMSKLQLVGYSQNDANKYGEHPFEVVETLGYAVGPDFPRLTPRSFVGGLAPQITRLTYCVNLDAVEPRPLTAAETDQILDSVR